MTTHFCGLSNTAQIPSWLSKADYIHTPFTASFLWLSLDHSSFVSGRLLCNFISLVFVDNIPSAWNILPPFLHLPNSSWTHKPLSNAIYPVRSELTMTRDGAAECWSTRACVTGPTLSRSFAQLPANKVHLFWRVKVRVYCTQGEQTSKIHWKKTKRKEKKWLQFCPMEQPSSR